MNRQNKKTGLKTITALLCSFTLALHPVFNVKAETIDDIRELAGIQRKDSIYSSKDRAMIMLENKKRESHNRIALLLQMSDPSDLNDINSKKRKEVETLLLDAKKRYKESLVDGSSVDIVLSNKTEYDNAMYLLNRVPSNKDYHLLDFKDNPYKEKAEEIDKILKEIAGYKNVGITGKYLLAPVETGFTISAPFPYKVDSVTGGYVRNNGVDLKTNKGSLVVSTWAGTVSRVKKGKEGLYTVEVTHDTNFKTVYQNVTSLKVKQGSKVKQHGHIGLVGGQVKTTTLHYEVWVDGAPVNPMFFFGSKGRDALSNFVATSDDILYQSMSDVVMRIKDGVKGVKPVYIGGYYPDSEDKPTANTPKLDEDYEAPNSIGELLDVPYR